MNGKNVMVNPCENIYLSLTTCHVTNYDKNCTILCANHYFKQLGHWPISKKKKKKKKEKKKERKVVGGLLAVPGG